jgi:hypothetical protein
MKRKRRVTKDKVAKKFLLSLLEPYQPILMPGEKITDLSILTDVDHFEFKYTIMKGGVENSKELQKGDCV